MIILIPFIIGLMIGMYFDLREAKRKINQNQDKIDDLHNEIDYLKDKIKIIQNDMLPL